MFKRKDDSYDKNSLQTPPYMVSWLKDTFGIDFDLCADDVNHVCKDYYTERDNALTKDWHKLAHVGFCNPPYSRGMIDKFVTKAIRESRLGFTTVMLMPELNGELRTFNIMRHAEQIIHFNKRVQFIHPITGKPQNNNNRGSIIVVFSGDHKRVHKIAHLDAIIDNYVKEV